ncbi:Uncharacterised protein g4382 [Pycnogonum litorale]
MISRFVNQFSSVFGIFGTVIKILLNLFQFRFATQHRSPCVVRQITLLNLIFLSVLLSLELFHFSYDGVVSPVESKTTNICLSYFSMVTDQLAVITLFNHEDLEFFGAEFTNAFVFLSPAVAVIATMLLPDDSIIMNFPHLPKIMFDRRHVIMAAVVFYVIVLLAMVYKYYDENSGKTMPISLIPGRSNEGFSDLQNSIPVYEFHEEMSRSRMTVCKLVDISLKLYIVLQICTHIAELADYSISSSFDVTFCFLIMTSILVPCSTSHR